MSQDSLHTTMLRGWVERMRAGDDSARDELLRTVCQRLEHLTHKMLKSFPKVKRWEETGDVLNSALVRLMRALQTVDPNSIREFYGLATKQIRRELLDLAKHYYGPQGHGANHHSSPNHRDSDLAPMEPEDDRQEDKDLDQWCAFHKEVENLSTREREVVNLIFYHGWTQIEVAELLQLSDRQVRSIWKEARFKLAEVLQAK